MKKRLSFLMIAIIAMLSYAWADPLVESSGNQGSNNTKIVGTSYTLDGKFVAGKGAVKQGNMPDSGVKLRSNQGNLVFEVNAGYKITKLEFWGCGNTETAVDIVSATVDGGKNQLPATVTLPGKATDGSSGDIVLDNIAAEENITLTFAQGSSAQIVGTWKVTYEQTEVIIPEITAVTLNGNALSDADLATLKSTKALTIDGSKLNGAGAVDVTLSSGATVVTKSFDGTTALYKFTVGNEEYTITVRGVGKVYAENGLVVAYAANQQEAEGANTKAVTMNGITFTMVADNKTFQYGSGNVTLGENVYVPLKLSTGSAVNVTFPDGKKATKVTVYGWSANGNGKLNAMKESAESEKSVDVSNDVYYATNTGVDIYPSVYEYELDNWESLYFNPGGSPSQPFVVMEFTFAEEQPAEASYYVVGSMNKWQASDEYKLATNEVAEGEYMTTLQLTAGDELKVIKVEGETTTWYPDGMDNNLKVEVSGEYDVYFRPDGQGGQDWYLGYIYLALKDEPQPAEPVVFTFNTDEGIAELGIGKPAASAGTNLKDLDPANTLKKDIVTITNVDGSTATRVWNSSGKLDLRVYTNATLTFKADNKNIKKIELAGASINAFKADDGEIASGVWEGDASEVTLTATANGKINTITVTYGESGGGGADDPVYIAAGDKAVWGSSWDAKDTNNQLTKDNDGKFSITKEDLNLAAGEYGYKIVKDGAWIPDGTDNDKKLSIAENGKYAVTLTVDPEAEADYLATATKTGEYVEPEPVYVAVGVKELWGVDAWTIAEENTLIKGNDGKYSITKENLLLPEGQYGYKIVKDGNTWIPDGTDNEKKLEITETAYYNVTLTVDPADVENYLATAEKAAPINTIAEVQAAEAKTEVTVQGIIYASAAKGAVLYDGDDYLYYYNTKNALNIGQKVLMAGKVGKYGGASQLTADATITDLGTVDGVVYPDPVELKAADFDAIAKENTETVKRQYVTYTGKLTISNNYYNIAIEGTEANIMAALVAPKEDISDLNGKDVVVKGYMMYKTTSNNTIYAYTVATSVEEYVEIPTYTATFTTNLGWENVYAYAWAVNEEKQDIIITKTWPGDELEATEGVYTFSINSAIAPQFIIFNDGTNDGSEAVGVNKTGNLPFVDGMIYSLTTEKTTAWAGDPDEAIPATTGIEISATTCKDAGVQAEKIIRIVAKEIAVAAPARGLDNTVTGDPNDIPFSIFKADGETELIADKDITVAEDLGAAGKAYEFTATASVAEEITKDGFIIKPKTEKNVAVASIEVEKAKAPAPVADIVYDFAAAAAAGENPENLNGGTANGAVFYGWESAEKTYSKRQDYKGYTNYTGTNLPAECHVWRRSDRINNNVADGGLKCPNQREMAINGLAAGKKVVIEYTGTGQMLYATGYDPANATAEPNTVAIVGDGNKAAISGTTAIPSGTPIHIVSTDKGYFVFRVLKGMVIQKITISDEVTPIDPATVVMPKTITVADGIENGTVKVQAQACAGDEVTVTATPAEGYKLDAITVTCKNINEAVTVTDGKFTMPADDVTVSATFADTRVIYDFAAAAAAGENPENLNGGTANGAVFYGWESAEKTYSKRQDYKGYTNYTGTNLPAECHVWRRSDRINNNVADGGLKCPNQREMAINGLSAGSKVVIEYTGEGQMLYATGYDPANATAEPNTVAIVGDGNKAAISGTTAIPSGTPIHIVSTDNGYFVFRVLKNMVITKITISEEATPIDPATVVMPKTITVADGIENGTVKVQAQACAGDEVTVTATPAEGYELNAITVTCKNINEAVVVTDGKFTMPADDVTVSATFVEKLEYYLVGNMTEWKPNAEYKLTANTAAEGVEYMITVDLAADAQFKIAKSNGTIINDDDWYPQGMGNNYGENGELQGAGKYTVYFRPNGDGGDDWFYHVIFAQKFYNITVVNCDGMTITPEVTEATAGTKVWATVAMTEGYEPVFPGFTNTDTGDVIEMTEDTDVGMDETGKVWIIMPAQNLTITAKAAKVSLITLELSQENGSATCISVNAEDPTSLYKKEGKEIYLTVTPNAGYTADITVTAGEDPVEVIAEAGTYHEQAYTHKFIMPAKDVTVKVTFTKSTGINGIVTDDTDDNAPIYNLAGQKVDKNYKGVVIKNGKKVYQK